MDGLKSCSNEMEVIKTEIEGLLVFKPRKFEDERGYFFESFNLKKFQELVEDTISFVQDNESVSKKGVVRGLHFQKPPMAQGKLVRVGRGSIIDYAVDIRKNSQTYGQTFSIELSAQNALMLWIPVGFAHGFVALENDTQLLYKCTNYYSPESESTILWNDEDLSIDWRNENFIVSSKDKEGQKMSNFSSPF